MLGEKWKSMKKDEKKVVKEKMEKERKTYQQRGVRPSYLLLCFQIVKQGQNHVSHLFGETRRSRRQGQNGQSIEHSIRNTKHPLKDDRIVPLTRGYQQERRLTKGVQSNRGEQ